MIQEIVAFFPSLFTGLFLILLMFLIVRLVERRMEGGGRSMVKGVVYAGFFLVGIPIVIALLPISASLKENILTAGGLIVSAVVAFSSTTVIRDAAAGLALRFMESFRRGDYLETDQYFGRVSEVGLVHTELQTEDRSLVTLSNGDLLDRSFKSIPSSGTILKTQVSLGYDVPRTKVETVLKEAAVESGLEEPFVHVLELGDFSVTYKVAGLLEDVENLLTLRSDFRKTVLDYLHENGIEIVSPNFTNRRDVTDQQFIPAPPEGTEETREGDSTEGVVFEKALEAKQVEDVEQLLQDLKDERDSLKEGDEDVSADRIEQLDRRIETIKERRDQLEENMSNEDD